jgi:hypothetical protein
LRLDRHGRDTAVMSLESLRRMDDDLEAAVRRISIVKLVSTIVIVWALATLAMLVLGLLNP